jgi:cellulose synthase/poly-beta-1,6-N-acetylglucosamine synthase-like glycosyltransferase
MVYVDSGSTDGSVDLARRLGAEVVDLDMEIPFTAARARNTGIVRALELAGGDLGFVLVLDGDCELAPEFFERALSTMKSDPRVAVVCGRRRERHRDASIYNTLCDLEWDTPLGDAEACGGDALLRVSALRQVGGYDEGVIAGEEPELCFRLRRAGWFIRRIDGEMTLHDAAMTHFWQWWRRAVRAGHAYADLYARHRYWAREVRSILVLGLVVPSLALTAAPATAGCSLGLFGLHAVAYRRALLRRRARGDSASDAALYARFCVVAKFAQLAGMARFVANRALGRRAEIIEYKPSSSDRSRAVRLWPAGTDP